MAERLTDKLVKAIEAPASGNRITYDDEVKGFGVRVTQAGAKAFILNYRAAGRERRITIGSFPDWSVPGAREQAKTLKRRVDVGEDPMADRHAQRAAPDMSALTDRYLADYALPRKRERSVQEDRSLIEQIVRPRLGKLRVEAVRRADVAELHREVSRTAPVRANRALSLLTKMFNLAIDWEIRSENPCKGIEKNQEERRERFLSPAEIVRLSEALAAHRNQKSANAIRLLLLTGARRGEVLNATWAQFDLDAGVWTKPAATTKQKKVHRVPLSAPALQLLTEMRAGADAAHVRAKRKDPNALAPTLLFPGSGRASQEAQGDLKKSWASICKAAKIEDVRVHDLRHTFASVLASSGLSLPIIGALLGHSVPSTTARYSHLVDDALRAATERAGAVISGRTLAEVVKLGKAS